MPTWNEPDTRAIGARIAGEMAGHDQGLTDPHTEAFDRALDVNLTLGTRLRAKRGQTAAEKQDQEMAALELTREGKNGRELAYRARKKQKAKAEGGAGRTDEFEPLGEENEPEREPFSLYPADDDYEPEEGFGAVEDDPYGSLPEHIARHLRDDEAPAAAVPEFTVPDVRPGDPYSALEGSLGYLDTAQLGELAVAVQNDPSLTAARRFDLSQRIGRVVAAR